MTPRRVQLVCVLALSAAGAYAAVAAEPWWDNDWDYRAQITCPPGAGDVAHVTVTLGGRTHEQGHDLRLIGPGGVPRPFEILHHDPNYQTVICFEVPDKESSTVWLYYGNPRARKIDPAHPGRETYLAALERWRALEQQREHIVQQRRPFEERLAKLRRNLQQAQQARNPANVQNFRQQIANVEAQLSRIGPAPENPKPELRQRWYPRRGVLLRTYHNPTGRRPDTRPEWGAIRRRSTQLGAGYRDGIADGFNPFGPSDHYLSEYHGYLRIDQPGEYAFCTVSDDGSWLLIDGREVVAWPGGHGFSEGARGEKHGVVELRPGVIELEYLHEELNGGQMAYVGWKPPGAQRFEPIPRGQWLGVRSARVDGYAARRQMVFAVPHVECASTFWAPDSDELQASLLHCTHHSQTERGAIADVEWRFADGVTATTAEVEHVVFTTGRIGVTLTVTDERGESDSVTLQVPVFQVDVVAAYFKYGTPEQYAELAAGYDVSAMSADALATYATFWRCMSDPQGEARAGEAFVARFPDDPRAPAIAASAAAACLEPKAYDAELAAAGFEFAAARLDGAAQLRARCDLADVLAWHLARPAEADQLYKSLLDELPDNDRRPVGELRRRALIGRGDAALLTGDYETAEQRYRAVPPPDDDEPAQAETLAKTGGNAYVVEDLLARGEYLWARRALDEWESQFPVQKLEGLTFFLRGKVLYVEAPTPAALRYLELAERVAPKAIHVPEAVWLRANCLQRLGRSREAGELFIRIRNEFTYSQYYERAAEKLGELRQAGQENTDAPTEDQ